MSKPLTPKQEKFAQCVASGMTQADAYREAFGQSNMSDKTLIVKASQLMAKDNIGIRVQELQNESAKVIPITVQDLINELEEARVLAMTMERPNTASMVQATLGKGKLLGLEVNKHELTGQLEHNHTIDWWQM